jgi:hypothetical protein
VKTLLRFPLSHKRELQEEEEESSGADRAKVRVLLFAELKLSPRRTSCKSSCTCLNVFARTTLYLSSSHIEFITVLTMNIRTVAWWQWSETAVWTAPCALGQEAGERGSSDDCIAPYPSWNCSLQLNGPRTERAASVESGIVVSPAKPKVGKM